MTRAAYTARVYGRDGSFVKFLPRGSTAGAALTNLRRSLVGPWVRIEVGTGEGDAFRFLAEVDR